MKFTQIRNATTMIHYAGKKILVDPMLSDQGTLPPFAGEADSTTANPLVALPLPLTEILRVDAVLVTHLHRDHWDEAATQMIPKDKLIFVQNKQDAAILTAEGFWNIQVLDHSTDFEGITFIKTKGQHGSPKALAEIGDRLGEVCGVILKHPQEQTLYLMGDTLWYQDIRNTLITHQPDIIVVNCGDARIIGYGSIIMSKEDIEQVHQTCPQAIIIASHMEAVNHATLSRTTLRNYICRKGLARHVLIPEDGEFFLFASITRQKITEKPE